MAGVICPATDLTDAGSRALPPTSRDAILTPALITRYLDAYAAGCRIHESAASPLYVNRANLPTLVIDAAENDLLINQARSLLGQHNRRLPRTPRPLTRLTCHRRAVPTRRPCGRSLCGAPRTHMYR
uniref:alpha/beta hydrolase fold domain-containing protein n=1 Tax=Mycolicibacterium fortuitum TaxID=1766 RepID=UPI00351F5725